MVAYPEGYTPAAQEPHCGVLATAICAGVTFDEAREALLSPFATYGIPAKYKGKLQRGMTWATQREAALLQMGVTYVSLTGLPAMTLKTFVKRHAKAGRTYMVTVTRHVVTVRDGMVIDQSACAPVDQHPSRNKRLSNTPLAFEPKGN